MEDGGRDGVARKARTPIFRPDVEDVHQCTSKWQSPTGNVTPVLAIWRLERHTYVSNRRATSRRKGKKKKSRNKERIHDILGC